MTRSCCTPTQILVACIGIFTLGQLTTTGWAQAELSLTQIMADPDWIGRAPESPYWSDDGSSFYFEQKREGQHGEDLFHAALDGRLLRQIPLKDRGSIDTAGGAWDSGRKRKVYRHAGDLFIREVAIGNIIQLTRTTAEESSPRFLSDDNRIWFHRQEQIFVRRLDDGLEYEPAVIVFDDPPEEDEDDDYRTLQQRRLIEWVRTRHEDSDREREEEMEARRLDPTRLPRPFYLGESWQLKASSLSPSGDDVLLILQPKERDAGETDSMPNYVSEDGYLENRDVRVLVGTAKAVSDRIVLLKLKEHLQIDVSLEQLPGIDDDPFAFLRAAGQDDADDEREKVDAEAEDGGSDAKPDGLRAVHVGDSSLSPSSQAGIVWSPTGDRLVLQLFASDHKDRWIATVDLEQGTLKPLERIHDSAWINWTFNEIGWIPNSDEIFYTSEQTGYSHLYLRDARDASSARQVTTGRFVVSDVTPTPDGRYLYFTANVDHPGIYEVHRYDRVSNETTQLTTLSGMNDYLLSPNGQRLLITHSTTTRPNELYIQMATPGAEAVRVSSTISDAFSAIDWVAPEIVAVPSQHHDRAIYSRVYTPDGDGPHPAVVFVHGAGYLQNAHHGWSGYFREFMFHSLLVQKGYVVLDMDYRASAGYGRDWRTAIYRRMGEPELEDLEDGVQWLVASRQVDAARIGVYGGSYGGFITFMSMFKQPELFACGASLRPVTDWSHYNHSYTSRILNTPDVDPEAYERSSPIEFAEGLQNPLLIAHGMLDDNVFFKDSVRLVQRLIELEKENWEMAMYPIEPHGFREPSSWLDEYRRILSLFERHLKP